MSIASIIYRRPDGMFFEKKFECEDDDQMREFYNSWMNHPVNAKNTGSICDWTDSPLLDYYRF